MTNGFDDYSQYSLEKLYWDIEFQIAKMADTAGITRDQLKARPQNLDIQSRVRLYSLLKRQAKILRWMAGRRLELVPNE